MSDSEHTTTARLDSYMSGYTSFNDWLIRRRYLELTRYFKGDTCLELGSAEGSGTEFLLDHKLFKRVVAVDGSKEAIDALRQKFKTKKLETRQAFFEDIDFGTETFDTVVLAHILEHVDDPIPILKQAKKFVSPGGVVIIDVPNGDSLHRQVGVKMGLMKKRTELNSADLSIGHQRVYTPITFKKDVEEAGLKIKKFGGMFVKVLSNSQTEKVFSENQLEALFAVGGDNPDIAAEMYILATL